MSELLTMQDLANGHLDIKALGEAANGDENTIVTTRTGNTYPSAERAINIMFQNGGLPAIPFATKALMTASALVDGKYAQVTDDSVAANNGLYVKEAGAWVKSLYDPVLKSKDYTDDAVKVTAANAKMLVDHVSNNENLVSYTDANGDIYSAYDERAHLMLSDMPESISGKSVQEALSGVPAKAPTHSQDIERLEDADGNVVRKLTSDGHFFIPHLSKSLQHTLEPILPVINQKRRLQKEFFADSVTKYISHLSSMGNLVAPMPLGLLPSRYTVPDTIISTLVDEGEHTAINLESPYLVKDDFVHPCIIECQGSFRGYRYLLMINPFLVEYWENPTIYGSNNLVDFDLLDGFDQPIANADHDNTDYRSFLSDSCWSYDPVNGELLAMWRSSYWPNGAPLADVLTDYRYSRTKDLLNWTDEEIYIPPKPESEEMRRSPSVLFNPDDGLWYMYSSPEHGSFEVRTASDLHDTWSAPINIPLPSTVKTWHQEVKYVGNKFVALFDDRDGGRFYMGISSNGVDWTISTKSLFTDRISALYKGTFLPELTPDGTGVFFHVFYTWYDRNRSPMNLMHVKTNTITI